MRPPGFSFAKSGIAMPLVAAALTIIAVPTRELSAKTPGETYCFGGWCHRVSTLDEMHSMVGRRGYLKASYYDDCSKDRFNPCGLTSSGAVFRPDLPDNAASPIFPDGTIVLVYNYETKKAAVLRVNSAGPYRGDRRLDVSRATAEKLGFLKRGVAELAVTVIKSPEAEDARYKKMRNYAKVPGYIGVFASFEAAHDAALASLDLQVMPQIAAIENDVRNLLPPEEETAGSPKRSRFEGVPFAAKLSDSPPVAALNELSPERLERPHGAVATILTNKPVTVTMSMREVVRALHTRAPEVQEVQDVVEKAPASMFSWVSEFVAAAREAAAPRRTAKPLAPQPATWSEWVTAFVEEARLKARASAGPSSPPGRFAADLDTKASVSR